MNDFLTQTYYGNTIQMWLISALIIVLSTRLARVGYWFVVSAIKKLTAKTQTQFDDILVATLEKPLYILLVTLGLWLGFSLLVLPETLDVFIRGVVDFVIILTIALFLVRILDALIDEYLKPMADRSESTLDDRMLPIVQKGSKMLIWGVALILSLKHAGYDVGALLAGLGIGGIALAMAAKDTIANIFGGFTILADRPFQLNDRIKIVGFDGTVKDIGVRSTRLQTPEGRIVTIPNSKFAESPVENISAEPARKITLELGLAYTSTAQQMEQALMILRDIANHNSDIEKDSVVFFSNFTAAALNITFTYYICKEANIPETQNYINVTILKRFNEAKLQFALPK